MIAPCELDRVESLLFGELPAREAAEVRAHLGHCADCAREWQSLQCTRSELSGSPRRQPERIGHLYPAIAQKLQARRSVRRQLSGMALTFASLCAVVLISNGSMGSTNALEVFSDTCARQCTEPAICELPSEQDEIAALEQRFAACLIATPVQ
ncbi:MAG: zf-HC2 domain-containing protein [Myxococcota bacterium]|nr:zf-HC2 domain-containing protein [Myxococcota bacterium]